MTTAAGRGVGDDEGSVVPGPVSSDDPAGLPGQWVDEGMSRQFAAANTAAWQLCRWVLECSRARAGTSERVTSRPRAGKIVAASLGWSEGYAAGRIEFARQVLERLPRLGQEMASGRLEEHKAHDIVELVADLDDAQAREVVERVLDAAPRLGFLALRQRVALAAGAVDPGWAERRRAAAIARRRVTLRSAPSGAAELCGLDLPEDPAQDSHDRIVALGHAVLLRLKRAQVRGVSVGEVESEVMLTLTGPAGAGLYDLDVVEHVTARFTDPPNHSDGPGPDEGPGPDDAPVPTRAPVPTSPGPDDDPVPMTAPIPESSPGAPEDPMTSEDSDCRGRRPPDPDEDATEATEGGEPDPDTDDDGAEGTENCGPDPEPAAVVAFRPRTVLRLELRTVLGLDRRPGQLPGRGMITNSAALAMAWARVHGRWRIRLYDDHGALDHVLSVRPPATGPPPAGGRRRRHLVELTAYTRDLDALLAALDSPPGDAPTPSGDGRELLRRAGRALARERARPPEEHPAHTQAEADNRFPSDRLRDWVESRDQTCRAPGCFTDAVGCDTDHTLAVIDGGRTVAADLGPFCTRDHLFKHDPDTGWTVHQTRPGRFEWTSPTGRVHLETPEPYRPLPDPVPRAGPPPALPDHLPHPGPPGRPRANKHALVTDASLDTARRLYWRADRRTTTPSEPPF